VIETEGAEKLMEGGIGDRIVEEDLAAGRLGVAADCVPLTLFLASPAAAYVTGGYFAVDGGQLLSPTPV
jgi:NAD(P)-dependent dehydrogenase (short-subunit alcohol dehydrogenase family)